MRYLEVDVDGGAANRDDTVWRGNKSVTIHGRKHLGQVHTEAVVRAADRLGRAMVHRSV